MTSRRFGTVAYVVKAWPRLSETFILNEILSLERLGVPIRIFSVRDPDPGPVHNLVSLARARVTHLSLTTHWKAALFGNARTLWRQPRRYLATLLAAVGKVVRHRLAAFRHLGPLRHFLKAGYLADVLAREPCQHLHAHFASSPGLVALFASRLSGIPFTLSTHAKDLYASDPIDLRPKLREARAVITCTEYNRQHVLAQFGPECRGKVHRIYHGVDLTQFPFSWPHGAGIGEPLILSVARLVEKKGLEDLIAAAGILRDKGVRFRMDIIGTGPLQRALESQAHALGLEQVITFLGARPHETVRLAYRRASAFALPCKVAENGDRDGIPNVLLEAAASGVPMVSTPVSGIPELVESEREGLLVEPGQPNQLADALERVLASPELCARLVRAARAKLEEVFSLDRSATKLRDLFQPLSLPPAPQGHGAAT